MSGPLAAPRSRRRAPAIPIGRTLGLAWRLVLSRLGPWLVLTALVQGAVALIAAPLAMPPLTVFACGLAAYPDRSATLVLQIPSLVGGQPVSLSGPGIEHSIAVAAAGLPDWFWPAWNENAERYPLGIDVFLADGEAVVGLPRTTRASI